MNTSMLASVVINNYNYGRFLGAAIDSALDQTLLETEVLVVDDGSTDNSRDIIATYGERIVPILKANGGQASAFNAGVLACRGTVVLFLDSDDRLAPTAVEHAVELMRDPHVVKVHWPLSEIDAAGCPTGRIVPSKPLPDGDLFEHVLRHGPASHLNPPTSGNAWSRSFLDAIVPIPESGFHIWADVYLQELAPLYGTIARLPDPHGFYRVHRHNRYASASFPDRLTRGVAVYDLVCDEMSRRYRLKGLDVDAAALRLKSWFHRLDQAVTDMLTVIPAGSTFILADDDEWGTDPSFYGRRRLPFLEVDQQYWGPPPDDATAIHELDRLARDGARIFVLAWPAFWWRDYYSGLFSHLDTAARCLLTNDRVHVFDLWPHS